MEETSIVSLAKREEEIYVPGVPEPLRLRRDDAGLRLLQEIRDEAHRFAVSRHRRRRSARTLHSRLDELAGIGPRRRKLLIQTFGSVQGVREASLEDLQNALGALTGRRIFEQLHAEEGAVETEAQSGPVQDFGRPALRILTLGPSPLRGEGGPCASA